MAAYAAGMVDRLSFSKISRIYCNDGPGLCKEIISREDFLHVKDKLIKIVPDFQKKSKDYNEIFSNWIAVDKYKVLFFAAIAISNNGSWIYMLTAGTYLVLCGFLSSIRVILEIPEKNICKTANINKTETNTCYDKCGREVIE